MGADDLLHVFSGPMKTDSYFIKYKHADCQVNPGVEWYDVWSCTCNGECPSCGAKDIEPLAWTKASECFGDSRGKSNNVVHRLPRLD
jgi:hypothetical protein